MSDKYLTTSETASTTKKTRTGPHAIVRHGSVTIPIYSGTTGGKTRYTIAFHLNGRRHRRMFTDIDKAKSEAKLAAEKIQRGLASNNDLTSRERELFHAACKLLSPLSTPLVSAIEEYVIAREVLGDIPLVSAAKEFKRQNEGVRTGVSTADICEELYAVKKQDGLGKGYRDSVKSTLTAFCKAFPESIRHVKSEQIDAWLRETSHNPATRNNRLVIVRMLFNFAKQRSYLPKNETTEPMRVSKSKVPAKDTEIYTPEQFENPVSAPTFSSAFLSPCRVPSAKLPLLNVWRPCEIEHVPCANMRVTISKMLRMRSKL